MTGFERLKEQVKDQEDKALLQTVTYSHPPRFCPKIYRHPMVGCKEANDATRTWPRKTVYAAQRPSPLPCTGQLKVWLCGVARAKIDRCDLNRNI